MGRMRDFFDYDLCPSFSMPAANPAATPPPRRRPRQRTSLTSLATADFTKAVLDGTGAVDAGVAATAIRPATPRAAVHRNKWRVRMALLLPRFGKGCAHLRRDALIRG